MLLLRRRRNILPKKTKPQNDGRNKQRSPRQKPYTKRFLDPKFLLWKNRGPTEKTNKFGNHEKPTFVAILGTNEKKIGLK